MKGRILAGLISLAIIGTTRARGEAYFAASGYGSLNAPQLYVGLPSVNNTEHLLSTFAWGFTSGVIERAWVALNDFNGDAFPDVVFSHGRAPFYYVFDGKTGSLMLSGLLVDPISVVNGIPQYNGLANGAPVAAGDVNGDGIPDVIVGPNTTSSTNPPTFGSTKIRVYSGADGAQLPTTFTANGSYVAAADFNHDGKSDIITGGTAYDAVTGNALFTFPFVNGSTLAAGDVDGDGIPDIATASLVAAATDIFSGADQHLIRSLPSGVIALADMNGDARADLVVAANSKVSVYSGLDGSQLGVSMGTPYSMFGLGAIAAYAVPVPEVGTLGLLVCGMSLLFRRRAGR